MQVDLYNGRKTAVVCCFCDSFTQPTEKEQRLFPLESSSGSKKIEASEWFSVVGVSEHFVLFNALTLLVM